MTSAAAPRGLVLLGLEALGDATHRLRGMAHTFEHVLSQHFEGLRDIVGVEGRHLRVLDVKVLRHLVDLVETDLALVSLVALVAHDQFVHGLTGVPGSKGGYLSISWSQKRTLSKLSRSVTS